MGFQHEPIIYNFSFSKTDKFSDMDDPDYVPEEGELFTVTNLHCNSYQDEVWICVGVNEGSVAAFAVTDGFWKGRGVQILNRENLKFHNADDFALFELDE